MGNSTIGMLLIIAGLTVHQFEAIIVKHYGKKYGKGGMFFNAFICLFAMIYFFVTDKGGLHFTPKLWAYGLVNSTMYATGFYTAYAAYKTGSFGLTRLLCSFGVILPTFYGIIFLGEIATYLTYTALVLISVSLFLMNYKKNSDNDEDNKNISLKWIILVVLTVLSNAVISILGKKQVDVFKGLYENEFLIISLGGASVLLFLLGIIFERNSFMSTIKHGLIYGAGAGIFNGINNLIILVVYKFGISLSFAAPVRTGIGMVLSFIISVFLYKEKFTKQQIISVVIGVIAVVLMNIKL